MENTEQVMKPMSVVRAEFINSLKDLINSSMLPLFVIEPILKDMYNHVYLASQRQYEADAKMYDEQLKNMSSNKNQ